MERLLFVSTFLSAIGAGLMAGYFLAFAARVMAGLGRLAPATGIAAMQSLNVAVASPLFVAAFFGTAIGAAGLAVDALINWSEPRAIYLLAGALLYLIGTFAVTFVFNVPLNNRLATVKPDSEDAASLWAQYRPAWTVWSHVRSAAALAASACFMLALIA